MNAVFLQSVPHAIEVDIEYPTRTDSFVYRYRILSSLVSKSPQAVSIIRFIGIVSDFTLNIGIVSISFVTRVVSY